jgi:hypothetical protein
MFSGSEDGRNEIWEMSDLVRLSNKMGNIVNVDKPMRLNCKGQK